MLHLGDSYGLIHFLFIASVCSFLLCFFFLLNVLYCSIVGSFVNFLSLPEFVHRQMFLERCPMYVERMWLQHINPLFASSREATSTKPFCFLGLIQDCVEPLYTQWTQTERVPFLAHVSRIILKRGNSVEGIIALVLHHPRSLRGKAAFFVFLFQPLLMSDFTLFILLGRYHPGR